MFGIGTSHDPNWFMEFDKQISLVQTLPIIADLLNSKFSQGTFYIIPDDMKDKSYVSEQKIRINEEVLNSDDAFSAVCKEILGPNKQIIISEINPKYGWRTNNILNYLRNTDPYAKLFKKDGKKIFFIGSIKDINDISKNKQTILSNCGAIKVTISQGGSRETYAPSEQEKDIESEGIEKVAYKEQLKHLAILMKLIIKGASNALFIAGRGGVGKTATVEAELSKFGLQEGNGYTKISGTASPYGIYTTLFNNIDGIVLFDDCDSALNEQEGRNIIKAATDTKKIRRLTWMKKSSIFIPPAQYEDLVADSEDGIAMIKGVQVFPSSFEFSGRVIFISNLKLDKLDPDGALRTRGYIININPSDAEVIDYMAEIAPLIRLESGNKLTQGQIDEVISVIKNGSEKDINLRKLVRGLNIRDALGGDDSWKTILKIYA